MVVVKPLFHRDRPGGDANDLTLPYPPVQIRTACGYDIRTRTQSAGRYSYSNLPAVPEVVFGHDEMEADRLPVRVRRRAKPECEYCFTEYEYDFGTGGRYSTSIGYLPYFLVASSIAR